MRLRTGKMTSNLSHSIKETKRDMRLLSSSIGPSTSALIFSRPSVEYAVEIATKIKELRTLHELDKLLDALKELCSGLVMLGGQVLSQLSGQVADFQGRGGGS